MCQPFFRDCKVSILRNKCSTTETIAAEQPISPAGSTPLLWGSSRTTTSHCRFLGRTWEPFLGTQPDVPSMRHQHGMVTPALSLVPGKELCVEMFLGASYTKRTSHCLGSEPDKPAILPCQNADKL